MSIVGGGDGNGQIGDGTKNGSHPHYPNQVWDSTDTAGNYLSNVIAIGGLCAVDSSNKGYCWGNSTDNVLGDNDGTTDKYFANKVLDATGNAGTQISNLISVASERFQQHSCGVTTGGNVYCWGYTTRGELGINSTSGSKGYPQKVLDTTGNAGTSLSNIVAVTTGGAGWSCAVDSNGHVYCWGYNSAGELGINSISQKAYPFEVLDTTGTAGNYLSEIVQISAGGGTTCAVSSQAQGGHVFCWGGGTSGQLGNGASSSSLYPVQVSNLSGIK